MNHRLLLKPRHPSHSSRNDAPKTCVHHAASETEFTLRVSRETPSTGCALRERWSRLSQGHCLFRLKELEEKPPEPAPLRNLAPKTWESFLFILLNSASGLSGPVRQQPSESAPSLTVRNSRGWRARGSDGTTWDPPTEEAPGTGTAHDADTRPGGVNVGPGTQDVSAGGTVRLLIGLPRAKWGQVSREGGGSSLGGNSQPAMT